MLKISVGDLVYPLKGSNESLQSTKAIQLTRSFLGSSYNDGFLGSWNTGSNSTYGAST